MSEAGWARRIISDDLGPSIQISMIENFFGNGETIAVGSNHSNTSLPTPDDWTSGIYVLRPGDDIREPWTSASFQETLSQDQSQIKLRLAFSTGAILMMMAIWISL